MVLMEHSSEDFAPLWAGAVAANEGTYSAVSCEFQIGRVPGPLTLFRNPQEIRTCPYIQIHEDSE